MKHILNNLSDEEKNAIREQHTGGMKVMTENFSKLINSKLGDSKPLVNEQTIASNILSGSSQKAVKQVFDSCRNVTVSSNPFLNSVADSIYKSIQGMGTDETEIFKAFTNVRDINAFCSVNKIYQKTYGTDLYSDLDGDIDEENLWAQISRVLRSLKPTTGAKPTGNAQRTNPAVGIKPTGGVPQKPTTGTRPTNFVNPRKG
jgi:hypothetical protein